MMKKLGHIIQIQNNIKIIKNKNKSKINDINKDIDNNEN